jgi:hypothetical protein
VRITPPQVGLRSADFKVRALLDVNVLIALLDSDHASHDSAINWFAKHAREGWASCPITQNGCIRIMSNPGYPNPLLALLQLNYGPTWRRGTLL